VTATDAGPPDAGARDRIRHDLDHTLFVEAGAGTGKTHALVGRILELILSGRAGIEHLAAITFTEAAAGELRDRVSEHLERAAAGTLPESYDRPGLPPAEQAARRDRAAAALADLDSATVTTLHGFARRVLARYPLEAGLPPAFEVLDEVRSEDAFDERWEALYEVLLEDGSGEAILRLLLCRLEPERLREAARWCDENWDRLTEPVGTPSGPPPVDAGSVLAPLRQAVALAHHCADANDGLAVHLERMTELVDQLDRVDNDAEQFRLLVRAGKLSCSKGQAPKWNGQKPTVKGHLEAAEAARSHTVDRVVHTSLVIARDAVIRATLEAAAARRSGGQLQFHDLLVLARDLVKDRPDVAAELGQRYRHFLIDEYQDTDPIQAELAVRLATEGGGGPDTPWLDLPVAPGRLFFVGDPLQSIYGFRRADLDQFFATREGVAGGSPLHLVWNHRSVPGVLEFVNHVMGAVLEEDQDGGRDGRAPYQALVPARAHLAGPGPVVALVGGPQPDGARARDVRLAEADDLARVVARIRDEGWTVRHGGEERPARLSDIAVLIRTRTGLEIIEEALNAADIPYRLESSSLVYRAAEVQEVLTVLRAVDDPTDEVAVVGALRTSLLGCDDNDLVTYHGTNRSWDYRADRAGADGPVVDGLAALHELHQARDWVDPGDLVARVVARRRAVEVGLGLRSRRERWRRLRFLVDQARVFDEELGGDLRHYLRWAARQGSDETRVTEVVLPEADHEGVRILTVHGAKGLEFPVVVVPGLHSWRHPARHSPLLVGPDGPEVWFNRDVRTLGYEALKHHEEARLEAEDRRLLYVALTRASDHLVVCLHRAKEATPAGVVAGAAADRVELAEVLEALVDPDPPSEPEADTSTWSEDDRRALLDQMAARAAAAEVPASLSATALARLARDRPDGEDAGQDRAARQEEDSEEGEGDDLATQRWRRGRAGTAFGRAVHGVLQLVDLATGEGLDGLARAQAEAEGIPGRHREVARRAAAALGAPLLAGAADPGRRLWRELYVGLPVAGRLLEGYIDLLLEQGDGSLHVVDYKTDTVKDRDYAAAAARYRVQGAAYAVAVEGLTGKAVSACTFLFLGDDGAHEQPVEDLQEAKDQVNRLMADLHPA
jgi:ATP-dependent exoDNAse (exonuclease V) beta subunit